MLLNKKLNRDHKCVASSLSLSLSLSVGLLSTATITSTILLSNSVSATGSNTDVVDKINITVPVSCTLEGTGMNSHNAEILNGQYNSSIGETTLKAFCNDNEGFAIYAIGYTDNLNGKNVMTNATLGSTYDIPTGTLTTGLNSQWAMKLSTITTPQPTYPIIIAGSSDDTERESGDPDFTSFQEVPDDYTLVAKRTSGTDIGTVAEGASLKTTYQSYISKTQPAGTYTGQVKYTLIHPHDEPTPPSSMLQDGRTVNVKMKNLAAGTDDASIGTTAPLIKSIQMANSLPANFEATETNTVSTPDSKYPIYIFFDNTNDAGIMYFYTENNTVVMNSDSSGLFSYFVNLSDLTGLSDWDARMVTTLLATFFGDRSLVSLHGLESWDVSKVETMQYLFYGNTALADISALSDWDTKSLTNIRQILAMGTSTTPSALTSLHGLEDWDVSKVTNMYGSFSCIESLVDISALAGWDTGSVVTMEGLFNGDTSLTTLHGLENWNTEKVTSLLGTFFKNSSLIDISALIDWDTSSVTNMSETFSRNTSLVSAHGIEYWDTSNVTTMLGLFNQDGLLTTIDVSNWNTENVTTMRSMFNVGESHAGNGQLTEIIGLEGWDVSNVTDMTCMFYGAGQMTHYDITDWDVSKVESFNHMFADNFKLESLDLSKWDVSSVKTMYNMFDDARALTTIGDVSHWNTVNLIDVGGWLNGATSFAGNNGTLDLSEWNTSNLKSSGEVFRATKLQTIDLSGWTFDSITNDTWAGTGEGIYYTTGNQETSYKALGGMFKNASLLTTVYVSQSGLNSFNAVVNNGVNTLDMWYGSGASSFTVK